MHYHMYVRIPRIENDIYSNWPEGATLNETKKVNTVNVTAGELYHRPNRNMQRNKYVVLYQAKTSNVKYKNFSSLSYCVLLGFILSVITAFVLCLPIQKNNLKRAHKLSSTYASNWNYYLFYANPSKNCSNEY